jgi:hypothetical protein
MSGPHEEQRLSERQYLAERVEDQIAWYGGRSRRNKRAYQWLRVLEISAAAVLPFLTGYVGEPTGRLKFVVGLLGVVVAVAAGLLALYKLQENWLQYRATCEALEREKYCFLTRAAPYDTPQPFPLFVQRVEGVISQENGNWVRRVVEVEQKAAATLRA